MTNNHPALAIDPYYDGVPAYMTEVYDWAYVNPKWRCAGPQLGCSCFAFSQRSATDACLSQRNQAGDARLATGACLWRSVTRAAVKVGAKWRFFILLM